MNWFWRTEQENNFQNALEKRRIHDFLSNGQTVLSIDKNMRLVIKGKEFFASVQQMQSLINPNPVFWNGFIQAAADAVNDCYNEEKIAVLYSYLYTLENEWDQLQNTKQLVPVNNHFYHTLGLGAGVGTGAAGVAMLCWIIAGGFALSMGPWAAAGIAVAILLVGLTIAVLEGHQVYKNIRAVHHTQLAEIKSFVLEVDVDSGMRTNIANPIELHINKDYGEYANLQYTQVIHDDSCNLGI